MVVNLAAQAGVRYSNDESGCLCGIKLSWLFRFLEARAVIHMTMERKEKHLVYASSSSVYGMNKKVPYSTEDKVDNPISLCC